MGRGCCFVPLSNNPPATSRGAVACCPSASASADARSSDDAIVAFEGLTRSDLNLDTIEQPGEQQRALEAKKDQIFEEKAADISVLSYRKEYPVFDQKDFSEALPTSMCQVDTHQVENQTETEKFNGALMDIMASNNFAPRHTSSVQ